MLKILELFGGVGACSNALRRLNIPFEIVDYVEIDKYAVKSYNAIYDTNFKPQDITTWDKDVDVDLIMHGSPCQDFSLAGKQAGGDEGSGTRSSLMYETLRIVEKLKPKYVVWENVKNILSKKHKHNFDAYLEKMSSLGYVNYYQVLNAKDYGIPQNRERVFTISIRDDNYFITNTGNRVYYDIDSFEFPSKQELKLKLKDLLDDDVDEKYYLSEKMIKYISKDGTSNFKNPDCKINLDVARPVTTDQNKRAGTTNYLSDDLPDNYDLRINTVGQTRSGGERSSILDAEGLCNTLTATDFKQPKQILIKNATKKGYLEATDGDGCYIQNIDKKRGTVQKEMIPTLKTSPDIGVVLKSKDKRLKTLVENTNLEEGKVLNLDLYNQTTNENISQCLTEPHHNSQRLYDGLRIRKLTPKECWRLMGFNDEDFEKAEKVNSNTQLYKQAGNSIVVDVLVAIFKNLFYEEYMNNLLEGL